MNTWPSEESRLDIEDKWLPVARSYGLTTVGVHLDAALIWRSLVAYFDVTMDGVDETLRCTQMFPLAGVRYASLDKLAQVALKQFKDRMKHDE